MFAKIEYGPKVYHVTFLYTPGTPGVHTLPNGDPGYPGDPPEVEVQEIICDGEKLCGSIAEEIEEALYPQLVEAGEREILKERDEWEMENSFRRLRDNDDY